MYCSEINKEIGDEYLMGREKMLKNEFFDLLVNASAIDE